MPRSMRKCKTDDEALEEAIEAATLRGENAALQIIHGHFRIPLAACRELLSKKIEGLARPMQREDAESTLFEDSVKAMRGMDEPTACLLEFMRCSGVKIGDRAQDADFIPAVLSRVAEINAAYFKLLHMGLNPRRLLLAYEETMLRIHRDPVTGEWNNEVSEAKLYAALREAIADAMKEATLADDILSYL